MGGIGSCCEGALVIGVTITQVIVYFALIIVGALYHGLCYLEPKITLWMIVSGKFN